MHRELPNNIRKIFLKYLMFINHHYVMQSSKSLRGFGYKELILKIPAQSQKAGNRLGMQI